MSGRRPEHQAPPDIYYNETEAKKYTQNSRMIEIQVQMTERALELLGLPEDEPALLLDLGCGSGLSGSVLEDNDHMWIGLDISKAMLDIALEREVEGDLILSDLGQGIPFRAGMFDGAVSISALQWLCNADQATHKPAKRLYKFFSMLYTSLSRTARAIFQFYPENPDQIELVTTQATKAGFFGGLVVDYPNSTKAKKYFLVLMVGSSSPLPQALGTESDNSTIPFTKDRVTFKKLHGKPPKKSKDWILEKKERRRRQGLNTREESKYTARRRCGKF
ncbi:probable 18S rRNA (guanine-N(7))-methyltransferase [Halyomorpha halys]|uniref:probable 18S rRNA (guanine-N(7))-methyltransferase n=1 Tax=Halyomorpha halys TaxID=286706 RepID=UPI0006D4E2B2|nr:probable 18S rRNA (guanine-N(7))-methyltransferase [Halyomorpha halys]